MGIDADLPVPPNMSAVRRIVACPHCKGDSLFHHSNASRPFCSPRCRALDLGAWANEDFRVSDKNFAEDSDLDDAGFAS